MQSPTVNARELHRFLKSGMLFNDWLKERISRWGFQENVDYCVIELNTEKCVIPRGRGRPPTKDVFVSLDMAKELAMVERNEQGKQARLYYVTRQ